MALKWVWKEQQAKYTIVECPTCGAEVGRYCVTSERSKRGPGRIISDAHIDRQVAALKVKYGMVES
jgi:hypothetical protein